ncbi:MAG TPA: hypothetical protein VK928_00080 [Longimicrobiales bacterium]|nr:hypothetical protein [Longimicrobiales bacterium]
MTGMLRGGTAANLVTTAAVALTVVGMMLVVGGVVTAGLFFPGVILILVGMVTFAVAGVLHAVTRAGKPARDG